MVVPEEKKKKVVREASSPLSKDRKDRYSYREKLKMSREELLELGRTRKWSKHPPQTTKICFTFISEEILATSVRSDKIRGAEIGVWRGWWSKLCLRFFPNGTLLLVDRWAAPEENDSYLSTVDLHAYRPTEVYEQDEAYCREELSFAGDRAIYMKKEFGEASNQVEDGSLDFIFLDADHSCEGTKRAWEAWEPKVVPGGIVAGHDWGLYGVAEAMGKCIHQDRIKLGRKAGSSAWLYRKEA